MKSPELNRIELFGPCSVIGSYDLNTLLNLVIWLIILGLIWWAVTTILGVIPVPEPIRTVVNVILIVILCLIMISVLFQLVGIAGGGFHLASPFR